jgi:signal transduction histidine kinase
VASRVGKKETGFIASLFEVPRELGNASMDEFLAKIVQRCADWFGATTVSLFIRDSEPNLMRLAATGGEWNSIPKLATIEIGKGIAGIAVQGGSPVLINEVSEKGKFRAIAGAKSRSLVSSMVVPLASPGGPVGVMNLSRKTGLDRFNQADLRLAKSIAGHLGLAIENARLVANLQMTVSELEGERAKFRGIFDGLGLPALMIDRRGRIAEANRAASELPELCLAQFWTTQAQREHEYTDPVSGRSWHIVGSSLPNKMATLVLEETTAREQQRRELDRLNRLAEIGQMTATIAHEIRNPLTGILSAAQMIGQSPEDTAEFAEIIEHEAKRLNSLCSDFLNFAKPLHLNMEKVSLLTILDQVAKLMRSAFEERGVGLEVVIGQDLPKIEGDPLRLEQVLQNLMLNALQATEMGGSVTIGVDHAHIWIQDTGCGMTEEHKSRLFTPFFTTKAQGTGLGLSTVKKIADAHRAELSVKSEVGLGTTIDIAFPERRAA